jgi:hypothetical protein
MAHKVNPEIEQYKNPHLKTLICNSVGTFSHLMDAELTQYGIHHLCTVPCIDCGECVPMIDMVRFNDLDENDFPKFESYDVPRIRDLIEFINPVNIRG